MQYAKHVSVKKTPQTSPIPGKTQVENNAGGFVFEVDCWTQLDRFLLLGAEGNTYYCTEQKMTVDNAKNVIACIKADGKRTVHRIFEISKEGRAPKNDPAVFALALAASMGDANTKAFALSFLPDVCRIPTHLFQFLQAVQELRGWSRGLRRAVANWYLKKEPKDLAYQLIKYQQRDGWTHRDALRLCHAKAADVRATMLGWVVGKKQEEEMMGVQALQPIIAFEHAKKATDKKEIVRLIREYNLLRECIPTQMLNEASVWEALLEKMPMTAMIRNLATMTRVGLLAPMSNGVGKVLAELANIEKLKSARIHPIAALIALKTYAQGHGERGKHTWSPVAQIIDALDGAFYKCFANVQPTGKRWLLACDVSGSMDCGTIAGCAGLTPRIATGALALVTAATEPMHQIVAFTSGGYGGGASRWSSSHGLGSALSELSISPRQRLDDVCKKMASLPMGGTDCSLPMVYALDKKIPVDVFVVYTDSETWASPELHPCQALQQYRQKMGIGAKLIVMGMTATSFSIADPKDGGMLDVTGFDAAVPEVMRNFVVGE